MDYSGDMRLKKMKVIRKHGVIANHKVGVITNFCNNYSLLYELFGSEWHAYVSGIIKKVKDMNKIVLLVIVLILFTGCSVNNSPFFISTIGISDIGSIPSSKIQNAKINYVNFENFQHINPDLFKSNINIDCTITELGFIIDPTINCNENIDIVIKTEIIKNLSEWSFTPAVAKNERKFLSSVNINWSKIFKFWLLTFSNNSIKEEWKKEPLYLDNTGAYILSTVVPIYPELAKKNNIQGEVGLSIRILRDGSVNDVIVNKSAHKLLDQASIDCVKQWKFKSQTDNYGNPTVYWLNFPMTFHLH